MKTINFFDRASVMVDKKTHRTGSNREVTIGYTTASKAGYTSFCCPLRNIVNDPELQHLLIQVVFICKECYHVQKRIVQILTKKLSESNNRKTVKKRDKDFFIHIVVNITTVLAQGTSPVCAAKTVLISLTSNLYLEHAKSRSQSTAFGL